MTATPFRHLNKQGYKFSMITTGISSHVRYLLEEKGVRLLVESFVEGRPLLPLLALPLTRAFEGFFSVCLNLSSRGRQSTVSMVFHAL